MSEENDADLVTTEPADAEDAAAAPEPAGLKVSKKDASAAARVVAALVERRAWPDDPTAQREMELAISSALAGAAVPSRAEALALRMRARAIYDEAFDYMAWRPETEDGAEGARHSFSGVAPIHLVSDLDASAVVMVTKRIAFERDSIKERSDVAVHDRDQALRRLEARFEPALLRYQREHARKGRKNVETPTGRIQVRERPGRLVILDAKAALAWYDALALEERPGGIVKWERKLSKTGLGRYFAETGEEPPGTKWIESKDKVHIE